MPSSELDTMLYTFKGILSDLPEEDQQKLKAATEEIRTTVAKYGDVGSIAAFLVAVEFIATL